MKETLIIFIGCILLTSKIFSQPSSTEKFHPLTETLDVLLKARTFSYKTIDKTYRSYQSDTTTRLGNCYIEKNSKDTLLGSNYILEDAKFKSIYSNYVLYNLDKNGLNAYTFSDKTEEISKPDGHDFNHKIRNNQLFYNSLLVIERILPVVLGDSNSKLTQLNDTLFNQTICSYFRFELADRKLNYLEFPEKNKNCKTTCILLIDNSTKLPIFFSVLDKYDKHHIYREAFFSEIKIDKKLPSDTFSIEKIPDNYHWQNLKIAENSSELEIGSKSPDFVLASINGETISSSILKGQLVLLEFWFPNCGGCVKSIPDINDIQRKYKNSGLNVYGIEFTRSNDKGIKEYVEKFKIEYPTLHSGSDVAKKYNVNSAPSFFLINKEGVIIYKRSGFDKEGLISAINKAL
jgi:peroxiredoxin